MLKTTKGGRLAGAALKTGLKVGLLAAVFGASACGPTEAGAAAIVGQERIPVAQVESEVQQVLGEREGLGAPPTSPIDATKHVLNNILASRVIRATAEELHVSVSKGEVDRLRGQFQQQTGPEGLKRELAASFVPAAQADRIITDTLLLQKLNERYGGSEAVQAQQQGGPAPKVRSLLEQTAQRLDIRVSPRYGRFDPHELSLVDAVEDYLAPTTDQGGLEGAAPGVRPGQP